MTKYFIIKLHIIPFDVMVSIDEQDNVLLDRLIKFGETKEECQLILNLPDTSNGRCVMFDSNRTVIRIKTRPKKHETIKIIAHEVFHATNFI